MDYVIILFAECKVHDIIFEDFVVQGQGLVNLCSKILIPRQGLSSRITTLGTAVYAKPRVRCGSIKYLIIVTIVQYEASTRCTLNACKRRQEVQLSQKHRATPHYLETSWCRPIKIHKKLPNCHFTNVHIVLKQLLWNLLVVCSNCSNCSKCNNAVNVTMHHFWELHPRHLSKIKIFIFKFHLYLSTSLRAIPSLFRQDVWWRKLECLGY